MNKMTKKRVVPVLLSLALVSGVAVFAAAAQTQNTSAAGKSATSSLTSFHTSSDVDTNRSVSTAEAVLPSNSSSKDQAAVHSAAAVPALKSVQTKAVSLNGTADSAKVKTAAVKSNSSCPYSSIPSSSSSESNNAVKACKSGGTVIISGSSIPCSQYFCGTSICSIIQCAPSTCQSTSCKSSSCKSASSGKPTASQPAVSSKPPVSSSSGTASSPTTSQTSYAQQVLQLVNAERAKNGLKALTMNANVTKAAQLRANEISTQFSHTRPNGQDPFTALKQFGVSYSAAGENIAYGQRSPQEVMTGWMNSSGHRANILNSRYTQIGIGVYQNASGVYYWTQEFIG